MLKVILDVYGRFSSECCYVADIAEQSRHVREMAKYPEGFS